MSVTAYLALMVILAVCCVMPGLLVVPKRLSPVERVVAAVGVSCIGVYLLAFAAFSMGLGPWAFRAALAASAIGACIAVRRWRQLLAVPRVRRLLGFGAALLSWNVLWLAQIRHYSGATWSDDWIEHHQRAQYFLGQLPDGFEFAGLYSLTARPPLMNVVSACFLLPAGGDFAALQVSYTFLNTIIYLPAAALVGAFARRTRHSDALVALLLAMNPLFVQNSTYVWTKLFAGFFVLAGIGAYLRSTRPARRHLTSWAFLFLAAACITHYSAVVYAVYIAGHGAVTRRRGALTFLKHLSPGIALGLTWTGWAIGRFGFADTLGSNTTVTGTTALSASENTVKILRNLFNTFVPHPLRQSTWLQWFPQQSALGEVRDHAFILYQTVFTTALGSIAGVMILVLFVRMWRADARARFAWAIFPIFAYVVGVAVHGTYSRGGLAHICLQPLVVAGIVFLASHLPAMTRGHHLLLLVGGWIDAALGIALHMDLQHRVFSAAAIASGLIDRGDGMALLAQALRNWQHKEEHGFRFLGDVTAGALPALQVLAAIGMVGWTMAFWHCTRARAER